MVNSGPIRPGAVLAGLEGGTLPAASCLAPEQIRLNLALRLWSGQMCRQGRERGGRRICSGMPPTDANADARRCHCMAMLSPGRPSAWPVPQKAAFRCAEGSGNARCTAKRQGSFLDTMAQTLQAGYLLEQSKKHLHAAQPNERPCHAWRLKVKKRLCQTNGPKRCMKEGVVKNSLTAKPQDLWKLL